VCADSNDIANTFVATNKWELVGKRPIALTGMQVGVAHAGTVHLDETLSRSELFWLLHWIVILDENGFVGGYDDSGLLGFWDAKRHYRRT
jgi:hypothetical protein